MLGLGGRLRLRPSVFVAAEVSPRLAGYDPLRATWGVALEKKTEGHTMQINFTNSWGTTFGQLARVGSEHDIYLGIQHHATVLSRTTERWPEPALSGAMAELLRSGYWEEFRGNETSRQF